MAEVLYVYGRTWRRYPQSPRRSDREYFKSGCRYLHHFVWELFHGPRVKGKVIHHIDGNCQNNAIENLEEITPHEHMAHKHPLTKERLASQLELLEQIRPKAALWHKSPEGKEWHKEHARKNHFGQFVYADKECLFCGNKFTPKNSTQKFCSNKCKSAWRRKEKADDVTHTCQHCGKEILANKYAKRIFCSKSCAKRYAYGHGKTGL